MSDYASLCFLSYQRPYFIADAIMTAVDNAGYPSEVICHDDGSTDPIVQVTLIKLLEQGYISHLILNKSGHNEGVGTAINRTFALATGDPIIKLDQDLIFHEDWLARTVGILNIDENIGMLGLFKYHHDPVDWREMRIDVPTKGGYHYTRQFCGSAMAIPRKVWEVLGPMDEHLDAFNEDSNFMKRVRTGGNWEGNVGWELALPDVDLVENQGFGVGPSTVVPDHGVVATIHHGTYVVNEKTCPPQIGLISPTTHEHEFVVGIVITTCAGREANLKRALDYIGDLQVVRPEIIGVIYDGCEIEFDHEFDRRLFAGDSPIVRGKIPKHGPGQQQPRNVGFDLVREFVPDLTHVWFLDSDLIVPSDTLAQFYRGLCAAEQDRVLVGPYDWLPQGVVGFVPEMIDWDPGVPTANGMADYRWPSFKAYGPEVVHQAGVDPFPGEDEEIAKGRVMGAGLAQFAGNLIWPVEEFARVGGFHIELHHGRCEDGELGLRAVEAGVPMSFVPFARAWHVWHPINGDLARQRNARDVPLLDAMHPGAQQRGLIVVDKDGKRFDYRCPSCGTVTNSLEYWSHTATHR